VFPNAVADSGHYIQYNDFYAANPVGKYRWNGVAYNSLGEWQAASGQANNIDLVPGFTEPDSENLHLVSGSDCINAGTANNASAEDYDGISRPQGGGFDIGAFEFVDVTVTEPDLFRPRRISSTAILAGPVPTTKGVWIKRSVAGSTGDLRVFDVSGRQIASLRFSAHQREIFWNGKDDLGAEITAGSYYIIYRDDVIPFAERRVIFVK
jgi:hypothetical protein